VIRAVGDPRDRLNEDHLRALRAVRFAARYGFVIELETREAIRRDAAALQGVSRERIGDEVRRMLLHPQRAEAVRLIEELALARSILTDERPAPTSLPLLDHLGTSDGGGDDIAAYALALAAWGLDRMGRVDAAGIRRMTADLVRTWRRALCLTNEETDALREILGLLAAIEDEWSGASVARRKRLAARPLSTPARRLLEARDAALALRVDAGIGALATTHGGLAPDPLITGDDLIGMGFAPGPTFRATLDAVYDAQLEGRVGTRDEAAALAQHLHRP
ncbi:MAG: CCA tRNA nucleotidyltransferase, partial [Phycisphaerales bacterium]|nr:CCA tRNA nucleotidyltransferase [Phycisphaerales bacterium]